MEEESSSSSSLSDLLAALALGARAVQGIPLEDDFSYQASFPEFASLLGETQDTLLEVLSLYLQEEDANEFDDPFFWNSVGEACEVLLEQVERHLETDESTAKQQLQHWSAHAQDRAQRSFGRLVEGIVDMDKPQDAYSTIPKRKNLRTEVFIPPLSKKPHATVQPLDLSVREASSGWDTRFGSLRSKTAHTRPASRDNSVAPSHHVPHVYQAELENLTFADWQLEAPSDPPKDIAVVEPLQATWVATPEALEELVEILKNATEVAVDLEAHSFRTFEGMICLMQISTQNRNFLIDPFPLWDLINDALADFFANPNIVKVMHGADSDVQWLQRDFGIYIVNLFDTGRAARILKFPSAGYAYLLKKYVGVIADKTHQLSDWRQRPLPADMRQYAIMDTHYLLDIYQHLRYTLGTDKIKEVLDASRLVCLIRYTPTPFFPEGYKTAVVTQRRGGKVNTQMTPRQERVMKALWDWRDATARECDESVAYVCSNPALLRLSLNVPATVTALQSLLNPIPPLLLRFSQEVLDCIQEASTTATKAPKPTVGAPSSAFFKPAEISTNTTVLEDRRGMLSPVLGTDDLYKQAGWITPQNSDLVAPTPATTTEDDDDFDEEDPSAKPRHLLVISKSNLNYRSKDFTTHSLEMAGSTRGRTVDGLATARIAQGDAKTKGLHDVQDRAKLAQEKASRVRRSNQEENVLGLISPTELDEGGAPDRIEEDEEEKEAVEEEEFVIPRSMREIYKISNRNRRNRKITSSPQPDRPPADDKELKELAKAEALLQSANGGNGYFDDNRDDDSNPKRQRTKSTESCETPPPDAVATNNEDLALMQEIGWIKNKEEAQKILAQRGADSGDGGDGDEELEEDEPKAKTPTAFDYSSVGPIGAFNANTPAPTNPFFTGAAMTGGALAQGSGFGAKAERKKSAGRGPGSKTRRQTERPEKKDGRSFVYKKSR